MSKKILVIGAGIGQINLCRIIKGRGYTLIVVTIPGDYPCIALADKVYYIDIYNRDEIVRVAKEERINAVISDQNDLMMPTVAYVADALGLPGNSFEQVQCYCNKNIFRDNCDKLGIPSPEHCRVSTAEIPVSFANIPYPWIVKPEDSQSSIGVAKVNNKEEYKKAIDYALWKSKNKVAIVEEFFVGREIVAEGFIYNGIYYNLGIADRRYFDIENIFIPSQTIFPSTISEDLQKKIIGFEQNYTDYVKPNFGIVHSEYLINETTGNIRVVESALRGGGVYISSHLVPLFTGININGILLDCSLGEKTNVDDIISQKYNHAAAYICFTLPTGIVKSIEGLDKVSRLSYVHKCDVLVKLGEEIKPMTYKGQRLGPIIISGENRFEIEEYINEIKTILKIQVQNSQNELHGIIWK